MSRSRSHSGAQHAPEHSQDRHQQRRLERDLEQRRDARRVYTLPTIQINTIQNKIPQFNSIQSDPIQFKKKIFSKTHPQKKRERARTEIRPQRTSISREASHALTKSKHVFGGAAGGTGTIGCAASTSALRFAPASTVRSAPAPAPASASAADGTAGAHLTGEIVFSPDARNIPPPTRLGLLFSRACFASLNVRVRVCVCVCAVVFACAGAGAGSGGVAADVGGGAGAVVGVEVGVGETETETDVAGGNGASFFLSERVDTALSVSDAVVGVAFNDAGDKVGVDVDAAGEGSTILIGTRRRWGAGAGAGTGRDCGLEVCGDFKSLNIQYSLHNPPTHTPFSSSSSSPPPPTDP
ncbi:hypothetical protein C0993_000907 [Termitomyces sp. T159_Od127]|nr:hypothetical protein C0993_000907 [Termitomyces sp. T159_Od127]